MVEIEGTRVAAMRKAKGWTQQDLADKLEFHGGSSVSRIERQERVSVAMSTVTALANAFGLSYDAMLAALGAPFPEGLSRVVKMRLVPYFSVKMPAGRWVESDPRTMEDADGTVPLPVDLPQDVFCLRIYGECMEPGFPDGSVIVFQPVRDGERGALQFEDGKPYYFEHTDGKATFKLVFYEPEKERFRLEPTNKTCKTLYVPEQLRARLSRAIKIVNIRDV